MHGNILGLDFALISGAEGGGRQRKVAEEVRTAVLSRGRQRKTAEGLRKVAENLQTAEDGGRWRKVAEELQARQSLGRDSRIWRKVVARKTAEAGGRSRKRYRFFITLTVRGFSK